MECDLGAGVGFPEPRSNLTGEFKGGTLDLDHKGFFWSAFEGYSYIVMGYGLFSEYSYFCA